MGNKYSRECSDLASFSELLDVQTTTEDLHKHFKHAPEPTFRLGS